MKNFISATLLIAVFFSVSVAPASAQTYYQNYTPQSQEATIAYLQGVIAQLMAQLAARGQTYVTYTNPTPTYTYTPSPVYYPGGLVLGESYGGPTYSVDVGTGFVRYSGNNVRLNGTIDLRDAPYANVWFEYGENKDDLNYRTEKRRATRDESFVIELTNLRKGRIYNYQAVAESPSGHRDYGITRFFFISGSNSSGNRYSNDDEPEARTNRVQDIDRNSAELHGEVDMNDFKNGIVFFVYGEDQSQVADVARDYDSYSDVDEDGYNLKKIRVDTDLDGSEDYWRKVYGLARSTRHYYQICVEYRDDDNDRTLECGGVERFETYRN